MEGLKLAALDEEDLKVMSAVLQDAVLTVGDIDWRPREKRLTVTLNRFVWEKETRASRSHERRRACLHFARVETVRSTRIRRGAGDGVLSLLAVRFEPTDVPAGAVFLEFSGGGSIRLDVECIEAGLADLGAAWTTEHRPVHEV